MKGYENQYVHDNNSVVQKHFFNQLYDETEPELEPFNIPPKPLNNPISVEEVQYCSGTLNNNRSAGFDNINAELVKYGPKELHVEIARLINQCFEQNEEIQIWKGIWKGIWKYHYTNQVSLKDHKKIYDQ